MYCPDCGVDHHIGDRKEQAALDREVEIARIQANRDIAVAKVTAHTAVAVAETENEIDTAHAEGIAEGMETALELGTGGQAAELGDTGAPIVVESPGEPEPEPEPEPDMMPPVVDTAPPARAAKGGWWDGYGR
jgi:hypothetical protein